MNKYTCSLDSLDAIFISTCGQIQACPKHYFYYKKQGYLLERIKIKVNKESKETLINYLITLKKKLSSYADNLIKQGSQAEASDWEGFNEGAKICNRFYWILISKKFVSMKLILNPFEFFLIQPKEKAQKFIDTFKIPDNWSWPWFQNWYRKHIFDYNYFKFEDSKYIHGWAYRSSYNRDRLSNFGAVLFFNFLKMSEYEMAYEIIQDAISYKEYYDHSSVQAVSKIAETFSKVLESYIENKNFSQSYEEWQNLHANRAVKNEFIFKRGLDCMISSFLNNKGNSNILMLYLFKARKFCIKKNYKNDEIYWSQELGWFYYQNKFYNEAKECFKNSVKYHKKFAHKNSMELLIEAYLSLAQAHSGSKDNTEMMKILKKIKKHCREAKDKFLYFATKGEIYFLLNDFDKAYNIIWKCIKISKQNDFKNSYELSALCIFLANIYTWKGDFLKAHKFLSKAKSLCSNLLFNDPILKKIYKAHAIFYINSQRYEDALEYITLIENNCSEHEVLFAKLSLGIAYFWMLNFDKASEVLTEVRSKMMLYLPNIYKNELFIVNAYIGELCNLKGNLDSARAYFIEAINFVDYYDIFEIDIFLKSSSFIFNYFYEISDYEKCEIILARVDDILENYKHIQFRFPYRWIQWAKLYIAWNEIEEAEECLVNAENFLELDKVLLSFQFNQLNCIGDYIEIAKIYIALLYVTAEKKQENYLKAEKILKYTKKIVNKKLRNDLSSKADIYYCLGLLYFNQLKFDKSMKYCKQSIEIYEKYQYNLNAVKYLAQILSDIEEKR